MEGVKISKRPRLKNPYLIVAWPGMGEVAFKSASFLVERLKAEECASISSDEFFYLTGSVIHEGILNVPQLPESKFYFWKNPATRRAAVMHGTRSEPHDLLIFISNSQPDLIKAEQYSKKILHVAKLFKVEEIISLASMPQPIDHTQDPQVWCVSTSAEINNSLKKYNFNVLSEGQISGMNGLFLGIAKREGFKGFCLLGDIPLYTIQIENPKAVVAVLRSLSKILGLTLDYSQLMEQVHSMEGEINKLLDYLKLGTQAQVGPIGEEEVERIKKALGQLTRLPVSVKDKIEKMFEQAKTDIKEAGRLKEELDKWNVYKEYEDRFLDLFRKAKGQGN